MTRAAPSPRSLRARHARPDRPDRPANTFDRGLQHERTELAWERTAISMVVAGMVLARYAALERAWLLAVIGLVQTALGAGVLVWSSYRYEHLHGPLRAGDDVVHPGATRLVGRVTIFVSGAALALSIHHVIVT